MDQRYNFQPDHFMPSYRPVGKLYCFVFISTSICISESLDMTLSFYCCYPASLLPIFLLRRDLSTFLQSISCNAKHERKHMIIPLENCTTCTSSPGRIVNYRTEQRTMLSNQPFKCGYAEGIQTSRVQNNAAMCKTNQLRLSCQKHDCRFGFLCFWSKSIYWLLFPDSNNTDNHWLGQHPAWLPWPPYRQSGWAAYNIDHRLHR